MKKICFSLLAAAMFASCNIGDENGDSRFLNAKANLSTANDSVSFAVGMVVAQNLPHNLSGLGIDSTTIDDFLRGLYSAFPEDATPEAVAYSKGVAMAAEFKEMLELANEAVYPQQENSINTNMYLEGIKAAAYSSEETMAPSAAKDYYFETTFRSRSEEFISNNVGRPGVVSLPGGVQYKIESLGTGGVAKYDDAVMLNYKGTFPNGAVFDSTGGVPEELRVESLVPGLAQVVTALPAGTKCMVYVPWNLAYGKEGTHGIPPYSALVFDLEIVGISQRR